MRDDSAENPHSFLRDAIVSSSGMGQRRSLFDVMSTESKKRFFFFFYRKCREPVTEFCFAWLSLVLRVNLCRL